MTDGRSHTSESPQTGLSASAATTVALPFITSTIARLKDTTARGSNPALRTSVRILIQSISPCTACRDSKHPGVALVKRSEQTNKKTPPERRCLPAVSARLHAALAAVPYQEQGARIHGL